MIFDWSLLGPPFVAGLLVVATHIPLGRRVLERGIIFIDLTIAQVAALGVIAASALGLAPDEGIALSTQIAAATAALAAAALLSWTEHHFRSLQEALIGSLYVLSACVAILLLAHNPHGAEHMQELLTGQILWVGWDQIVPAALLSAVLLAAWWSWVSRRAGLFYFLFALAVMISVQLVGVFLVFATLILPAVATNGMHSRAGVAVGYLLGALAYGLGLLLSLQTDLPAGPLIVCTLATLVLVTGLIRRINGARSRSPA